MSLGAESEQFLQALAEDLPENLWLLLWEKFPKPQRGGLSFWTQDRAAVAQWVAEHPRDVYLGVGLSDKDRGGTRRCPAKEIAGLLGLALDVDFADPVHAKAAELPPSREEAKALIDALCLPPSLLVDSGHGLQPWWLFEEPWVFDTPNERQAAERLAKAWNVTLRQLAHRAGWTVDSVFDLARIMRIPGTENGKDPKAVVPVRLLLDSGARYSPDDFTPHLIAAPAYDQPTPGEGRCAVPNDLSNEALLEKARTANNGPRFTCLYDRGDLSDYDSASEADLALASRLVWWFGPDLLRVDALFRRSALMRPKWNEKRGAQTYGERTLRKAMEGVRDFYPSPGYGHHGNGALVPPVRTPKAFLSRGLRAADLRYAALRHALAQDDRQAPTDQTMGELLCVDRTTIWRRKQALAKHGITEDDLKQPPRPPYTSTPPGVFFDAALSDGAWAVSHHLASRMDRALAYMSQEKLAKACGKSARQVRRNISELEAVGYLVIKRADYDPALKSETHSRGRRTHCNHYSFTERAWCCTDVL